MTLQLPLTADIAEQPKGDCCHRLPLYWLRSTYGSMELERCCGLHLNGCIQRHIGKADPILVGLIDD